MNVPLTPHVDKATFGDLLARYHPAPGTADELLDAEGRVRPVWGPFLKYLASLSPEETAQRFARGTQYLNDAGVFFRYYDEAGPSERTWPLSHIPILIDQSDWQSICDGLIQRAELLEDVVADLYGDNELVAGGHLPAGLIARNAEWLRPMVGLEPRSGHFLHFLAFELGRGPDGTWWVLGDRAQAPSGAGFALENRVATTRIFSDFYPKAHVHRLAGFFRRFRETLLNLRGETDSRVAILTPGLMNDTYFEHAYIARYLGFMLLDGEDLMVTDGKLMVRTIAGPRPISVLWRRLDANWADPLELDEQSQIGTPGMVEALRNGSLTMINALGSGVLETRALLAFLPRICEHLRGEPLKLPNIATWWCGDEAARAYVGDNLERMMISRSLSTGLPFTVGPNDVLGGCLDRANDSDFRKWLETEGEALVGQEAVTLSTTPAHVDGQLVPRPMSLRVFLARTEKGWEVMSGGFARIGGSDEVGALAMQSGGRAADVWIVGGAPEKPESLLPKANAPYVRSRPSLLPARAADNLFWLGRYVERAEGAVRLLRAYHARLAETGDPDGPITAAIADHLESLGLELKTPIPEGLQMNVNAALSSAAEVRDRFSIDGWLALNDLSRSLAEIRARPRLDSEDATLAMGGVLRQITGFSGLVHENMYRFVGWRFLSIGRSLERALAMCALLARFGADDAPEGALDLLLEVGDSTLSLNQRYAVTLSRAPVLDLLGLDTYNPRSVLYQLEHLRDHIEALPGADHNGQPSPLARSVLALYASLAVKTPDDLSTEDLDDLSLRIRNLSDGLFSTYTR